MKERGYNQIHKFCEAMANELKIPFENKLLVRNQYTATQSKKGLFDRKYGLRQREGDRHGRRDDGG